MVRKVYLYNTSIIYQILGIVRTDIKLNAYAFHSGVLTLEDRQNRLVTDKSSVEKTSVLQDD